MAKKMRNLLLMAAVQVDEATEATLTANTNAILCSSAMPGPIKATFTDRGLIRPYFGNSEKLVGGEHATLEFEVELASSGAAGTAPAIGPLLIGCGFAQTLTAGTSAVYNLVTSGYKYLTLACNLDGVQFKLVGALVDVTCEMNAKARPVLKFSALGRYVAPTDTVMPSNASFAAFMKPLLVSKVNTPTFTLHGTSPCVESFSWALGNQQSWRERINCNGAERTDRRATASLLIELPSVAAKNWAEVTRLGTSGALEVVHGVSAGHIVEIDAPKTTVSAEPTISDSEGDAMLNLQLDLSPNGAAGNDELVLTFR